MTHPERLTRAIHGARGYAPPALPASKSASCTFVELQEPASDSADNRQTKKPPEGGFLVYGPPGEIRTPDTQVRSLVLYPAELRAEARSLGLSFANVKKSRAV